MRILAVASLALAGPVAAQCSPQDVSAADVSARDEFGFRVDVDDTTAAVGARLADTTAVDTGAVYVLELLGGSWTETAKLVASDALGGDELGVDVAVDGDTLVAGAWKRSGKTGAAYVYERQSGVWSETAKLVAGSPDTGSGFGYTVDVSGDTIVVAALDSDLFGPGAGAVHVFERVGGAWNETAQLAASGPGLLASFGTDVALDGTVLVVGSYKADTKGSDSGSAYLFEKLAGFWIQTAELAPNDGASFDQIGISVDVDGDRAIVGARLHDGPAPNDGAAYVFERQGAAWPQTAKLTAGDGANDDQFGHSVALAGDVALVAAHNVDDLGFNSGAVYVYDRLGTAWVERAKLLPSSGAANDRFGNWIAAEGDHAIVGHHHDDTFGTDAGTVHMTTIGAALCSFAANPPSVSLAAGGTQALGLRAGAGFAGAFYWVVGSASGTQPGLTLGGALLPLNFDPYMNAMLLAPNLGPFVNTVATLDANGVGNAAIAVAAGTDPALAGIRLQHAFAVVDFTSASLQFVSNAAPLDLVP